MELSTVINERRATRSLAPAIIDEAMVRRLAERASLAPSCFNKQPWRYVFVYGDAALTGLKTALNSPGNDWAQKASLITAVACRKEDDCVVKEREYYLFDTGMATALLLLSGTEMGLVMHPIAGFDENKAKDALGIPADHRLITLVIAGKKAVAADPILSESQRKAEAVRPERFSFNEFARIDRW
ncbi:MAG: nitroreductase family protein [Spirochaetota bacterium]